MRTGVETGRTRPRAVLDGHDEMIDSYLVDDPTRSDLYEPFESLPATVPDGRAERLREDARTAIDERVLPALESFRDFLAEEYIPNSRESVGVSGLPDGEEHYEFLVRYHTTLDVTPDEVHRTAGGRTDPKQDGDARQRTDRVRRGVRRFLEYLRTDPRASTRRRPRNC